MRNKKILIIRNAPYKANFSSYNDQNLGMARAFCRKGYDCDLANFSDQDELRYYEEIAGHKINLLMCKGYKLLRTGYYPKLLDKAFLSQYDLIITTEYSQIMTYLLSKYSKNVILYSGPYYNLFKIPMMAPIYDQLFTKAINQQIQYKFTKSILAKDYLEHKGYSNVVTLGVGQDLERFEKDVSYSAETMEVVQYMKDNPCLLYVGSLDERKNFPFLLKVFNYVASINQEVKLVIVGKGKEKYVKRYMKEQSEQILNRIKHVKFIPNDQLKIIYESAKVFLLPSQLEIFGMVLLEAMCFGVPTISSKNGGSLTLINHNCNGMIMEEFDVQKWGDSILGLLQDEEKMKRFSNNAKETIRTHFTWDKLTDKILENIGYTK